MNLLTILLIASARIATPTPVAEQSPPANQETEQRKPTQAFLGVRVLKTERAGDLEWSVELPADCEDCRVVINELTSAENPKEFYFHLFAPSALEIVRAVRVKVNPSKVRGVIAGRAHVSFRKTADGIIFDVPQQDPSDLVAEMHTVIETPGVCLRIEHADERRRRGPYATGQWPALQRQAALNLEFAAREAIVALKLDRVVQERGLGVIQLMGFDTNYPTLTPDRAHDDYPPHWHMHMYWATQPKIRTIDHLFIGADGLLDYNKVAKSALAEARQKSGRFERAEPLEVLTPGGDVLFTETITPQGFFVIATPSGACRFMPISSGFQSGVSLVCGSAHARRIRAEDDLAAGRLRLFVDDRLIEQHLYDPDTGVLKRSEVTYEAR